jgi:cation transport ATPase
MAARLALSSHHPLAAAVAREARDGRPIEGAVEAHGQGVRAMIDGLKRASAAQPSADFPISWQLPAGDNSTS